MVRRLLRALPALLLIGVAAAFFTTGAAGELSPHGLARHAQIWQATAAAHPALTLAIYVAAYAVLAAAALPVAMVLTVAAGMMFGPLRGALAAIAAANLAAVIGYAAARSALGSAIAAFLARREGRLRDLVDALRARGFWPIMAARLMPVMPFAAVNIAGGLARTPIGTFVAATVLGGLPSAFIGAWLGAELGAELSAASLAHALRSPLVWGPLLLLSALSVLPLIVRRRRPV
jgi:uncharacterized membrane protein YdjX (TVP38/TMEM64 family)